jgi:serine protease DegQ
MGIVDQTMNSDIAKAKNLDANQQGVLVVQVEANSPADKAGLPGSFKSATTNGQPTAVGGDVIVSLDGKNVSSIADLSQMVATIQAGQKVTLTVLRNGTKINTSLKLEKRPNN